MNEEKKQEQKGLRPRLWARFSQPGVSDTLILRGDSRAIVYGCRRILQYAPERICLRVGKRKLFILGRGLICASFSGGAVTLAGRIDGVFFDNPEKVKGEKDEI